MWSAKTPEIIKPLAGDMVWEIHPVTNEVFLTFDDGPTPGVTDRVLDILSAHDARATFFCLGKNAEAQNELFNRIIADGHSVGNHTVNHVNGWKTNNSAYFREYLVGARQTDQRLFRPPYGRITRHQASQIAARAHVVMWDVLSGDFDPKTTPDSCAKHVIDNTKPGSIIVMHDSRKAADTMLKALPVILQSLQNAGYLLVGLTNKYLPQKKRAR